MFSYNKEELQSLANSTLAQALSLGATAAQIDLTESIGLSVSARMKDTEEVEYQRDNLLEVTVFKGQQKGHASTADFTDKGLNEVLKAALNIAQYTEADPYCGLADSDLMAREAQDLELYHEWPLSVEDAQKMALECEEAALSYDACIQNSEGANVHVGHHQYVYANTHGVNLYEHSTRHSVYCSAIAQNESEMQRASWGDSSRNAATLSSLSLIGQTAAQRAQSRLNPQTISTASLPVLFDSTVSGSLIGHLMAALSGGHLYRKSSFLCDSLGEERFSHLLNIQENPHILGGFASSYFDEEGVATQPRVVIDNGMIAGYFLSSYSARKLGMQTTANAGGAHNLRLAPTHASQKDLLKTMDKGILITELMGQGVNLITGDYSRGAAGFWVENGEILFPVEEITIASNLDDMFAHILGTGSDFLKRSTHQIGSILIENMTVAT